MLFAFAALALASPVPVSGWLVFWNPSSLESFRQNAGRMAEALPEWIACTPEGRAVRRQNPRSSEQTKMLALAARENVPVFLMASNFAEGGFDAKRVQAFLSDPAKRRQHIRDLVRIVREDGAAGLDLDYESLSAADREPFTTFVRELASSLHRARKKLSVTLHPKESEPGTWDGPQAQDYAAIGKAADVVRIMTYDFHWAGRGPGPIAPDAWVERVMTFAKSVIPADKLELGIAAYGYDWTTLPARSLTWNDLDPKPTSIDPESGELVRDKVYFGGAESARRKIEIAGRLGLRGVSVWYIGSEEPALWRLARR